MAYESRIYVINVHKETRYGEIVARYDLSNMGGDESFYNLFCFSTGYKIYPDGNRATDSDCYGSPIKSADINKLIEWLETKGRQMNYRRIEPLIGLLKGFKLSEWENLQVVHYGY